MGRKKKQISEEKIEQAPIICQDESVEDLVSEEEAEYNTRTCEILVGKKFKILITKRNYEILEWVKSKTKDKDGVEVEIEGFRNHYVYLGSLEHACKYLKEYIVKQKMCDKKTISSLSEAIQFIKDSNKETEKMFAGIGGI